MFIPACPGELEPHAVPGHPGPFRRAVVPPRRRHAPGAPLSSALQVLLSSCRVLSD